VDGSVSGRSRGAELVSSTSRLVGTGFIDDLLIGVGTLAIDGPGGAVGYSFNPWSSNQLEYGVELCGNFQATLSRVQATRRRTIPSFHLVHF